MMLMCAYLALPRIRPDPSQHLLSRYGLSGLHAKVARTDPVTHEKINKLRKSYEGQIKNFALAGRNKPAKDEIPEGQWSSLNMMMLEPEDSWYASKVLGKKIEATSDLEARLKKAMFLQPGRTKEHDHWDDVLGHEKPRPLQVQDPAGKKPAPGAPQRTQLNGNTARTASQAAAEAIRPRRTGKKRSYADNSFEGYGDGFVDDEAVDLDQNFLSNSEDGSHGPGRKKRKKVGCIPVAGVKWTTDIFVGSFCEQFHTHLRGALQLWCWWLERRGPVTGNLMRWRERMLFVLFTPLRCCRRR
jgi:Rox3 mediator complex subunit